MAQTEEGSLKAQTEEGSLKVKKPIIKTFSADSAWWPCIHLLT